MGPGFLGAAPARAYTVAGSFVRFLLDGYGPAPLRRVYREGGSDAGWRAAYGRPLEALAADWSRRIDATPLDPRERDRAAEPLKQPSIFHKTCAHELAVRREEARALAARGDTQGAIDRLRSICRDEPDDPSPLVDIVERAGAGGDRATALAAARRLLDQPKSSPGQRARVFLFLGDDLARTFLNDRSTGDLPAAAIDDWRRALELAPDEDFARQLRARLLAVEDRALGRPLLRYLVGDAAKRDPALDLLRAKEVADAAPERGLGHYLLGRMLASHDRFEEALGELDRALALGLPPGGFTVAALRVAGAAAFRVGDPARSERLWERVPRDPEADAAAVREARDFLDRCRFARAH